MAWYDKLIFPKPSEGDEAEWDKKGWDVELLKTRVKLLGPRAEAIEWNDTRRDQWAAFMQDADYKVDAYAVTRSVLASESENVVSAYQSVADLRRGHFVDEAKEYIERNCVAVRTLLLQPA